MHRNNNENGEDLERIHFSTLPADVKKLIVKELPDKDRLPLRLTSSTEKKIVDDFYSSEITLRLLLELLQNFQKKPLFLTKYFAFLRATTFYKDLNAKNAKNPKAMTHEEIILYAFMTNNIFNINTERLIEAKNYSTFLNNPEHEKINGGIRNTLHIIKLNRMPYWQQYAIQSHIDNTEDYEIKLYGEKRWEEEDWLEVQYKTFKKNLKEELLDPTATKQLITHINYIVVVYKRSHYFNYTNLSHADLRSINFSPYLSFGLPQGYEAELDEYDPEEEGHHWSGEPNGFAGMNLFAVNLSYANCRAVNFSNANLTNAILMGTNLEYANFTGVILTGTVFLHIQYNNNNWIALLNNQLTLLEKNIVGVQGRQNIIGAIINNVIRIARAQKDTFAGINIINTAKAHSIFKGKTWDYHDAYQSFFTQGKKDSQEITTFSQKDMKKSDIS